MTISIVNLDEDQAKRLLPPWVRGLLKRRDTTVFAAMENEDFIASAVVVKAEAGIARYCIRYLKVYNRADVEILGSILKEIEKTFMQNSSNMLAVKIVDDMLEHREADYILIKNGYTPIQLNGKFLVYSFKDIAEREFVKKVENLELVKKYVKFYRQVDKKQLVDLREKLKRSDANQDFERPDMVFGRFYIVNGEIKGYMDMREVFPGILMLFDVYAEKSKEAKNALPMMLASVIQLTQAMMPKDTVIILPLYAENLYKGFKGVFGEAVIEQGIFEYVKTTVEMAEDTTTEMTDRVDGGVSLELEEKLEFFAAIDGTDTMSPAMLKEQRDIMLT